MTGVTPKIYADFQKVDDDGRLMLTTVGTREDLERNHIELSEGLVLTFYTDDLDDKGNRDDLVISGKARYDHEAERWVAEVDWSLLKHASER
jgi:hypothetical protein